MLPMYYICGMEKNLDKINKQMTEIFNKKIQKADEITALFLAFDEENLSACFSGTDEGLYKTFCHFLFEHPDKIEILKVAIACAEDYHDPKHKFINSQIKGEA